MELNLITKHDVDQVIRCYNQTANKNMQYAAKSNNDAVQKALAVADNVKEVLDYVKANAVPDQDIPELMGQFVVLKKAGALGGSKETTTVKPSQASPEEKQLTQSLDLLSGIFAKVMADVKMDDIKGSVMEAMKNELKQFILDEYGPITKKVELEIGDETKKIEGVLHSQFPKILELVIHGFYPYLYGPSGTGKSYICKQVAEVLGRDFYFTNAVTQEYQLKGFTDANGKYQETQFYKAFKNGGVFLIDELDASIPEALIIINDALANGYFDFPAPVGKVFANPKFAVIAAGNTTGHGASSEYVARNQIDAASMDRFAFVEVDYDPTIEESLANGDKELLGFIRAYRKACKDSGIQTVVSYRAISRLAELSKSKVFTLSELMWTSLTKGLEKSDLQMVRSKVSGYGKYSLAFDELCK